MLSKINSYLKNVNTNGFTMVLMVLMVGLVSDGERFIALNATKSKKV